MLSRQSPAPCVQQQGGAPESGHLRDLLADYLLPGDAGVQAPLQSGPGNRSVRSYE